MRDTGIYATGIRPAVDKHLLELARERRDYGNYWSASSAGYCQRKVIFDRLQVPPTSEDARKQRVFTAGHIFHDWIQGITRNAGISVAQETELIDDTIMVKGHFDDLVLVDDHLILYDYKTQNSRAFTWQKKNGSSMSYFHRLQLGTYMYMLRNIDNILRNDTLYRLMDDIDLRNLAESRILKISKDDLRMSEELLFWDEKLEKDVTDYWKALNYHWEQISRTGSHQAELMPPCTCADHEGGFMAKAAYNPYFYEDEPCSLAWYEKCKKEGLIKI